MPESVYVETTAVSYLTARKSRDLVVAAHQEITQRWWKRRRREFYLYCSQAVERGRQARGGQTPCSIRRRPVVGVNESAQQLAAALLKAAALPGKATEDALHIALAAAHGMDYLLTWNCKHIANAEIRNIVAAVSYQHGYGAPVICTPEELLGE